jgi:hypothetical protein
MPTLFVSSRVLRVLIALAFGVVVGGLGYSILGLKDCYLLALTSIFFAFFNKILDETAIDHYKLGINNEKKLVHRDYGVQAVKSLNVILP